MSGSGEKASTATTPEQTTDGQSGDTEFPYIGTMKALATVGEMDAASGLGMTGYPDGQAAWLADDRDAWWGVSVGFLFGL